MKNQPRPCDTYYFTKDWLDTLYKKPKDSRDYLTKEWITIADNEKIIKDNPNLSALYSRIFGALQKLVISDPALEPNKDERHYHCEAVYNILWGEDKHEYDDDTTNMVDKYFSKISDLTESSLVNVWLDTLYENPKYSIYSLAENWISLEKEIRKDYDQNFYTFCKDLYEALEKLIFGEDATERCQNQIAMVFDGLRNDLVRSDGIVDFESAEEKFSKIIIIVTPPSF